MKVLLVGLGSIAKKHINALLTIDSGVQIDALRSSKGASAFENVTNIFQLTKDKSYDFAIISTPTHLHYKNIEQLLILNIPLFIEKPIFDNIGNEEETLVSKIYENHIPNYVACNLRFLDALNEIKLIIEKERINEVNVYCGSYLPDWRPTVDFKTVYSANKNMGGGVHIDLIHELDYVYWLFGLPLNTRSYFKNNSSLNITAYDYANYIWEYEGFTASIVLNYYRKDTKRTFEILTSNNTYLVDLLTNSIFKNKDLVYQSNQQIKDTYEVQLRFFINKILTGKVEFNTVNEAYEILKLCKTY